MHPRFVCVDQAALASHCLSISAECFSQVAILSPETPILEFSMNGCSSGMSHGCHFTLRMVTFLLPRQLQEILRCLAPASRRCLWLQTRIPIPSARSPQPQLSWLLMIVSLSYCNLYEFRIQCTGQMLGFVPVCPRTCIAVRFSPTFLH